MRIALCILSLALVPPLPLAAEEAGALRLTASEWSMPRSGERVLQLPAVAAAVRRLHAGSPAGRLRIRYAGGDRGSLWARDLESWLIGLGIGSDRIELRPGGTDVEALELAVVDGSPDPGKD